MSDKKNYLKWHSLKEFINFKRERIFFHDREIWFCSLGVNVGYEQDGKNEYFERPVVVLKKFNQNVFLGIPLTTVPKFGKHYFHFEYKGRIHVAILSQIRLFDAKRLTRKVCVLPRKEFDELKELFKNLI